MSSSTMLLLPVLQQAGFAARGDLGGAASLGLLQRDFAEAQQRLLARGLSRQSLLPLRVGPAWLRARHAAVVRSRQAVDRRDRCGAPRLSRSHPPAFYLPGQEIESGSCEQDELCINARCTQRSPPK
jgi:hypothetical protein